MSHSSSTSKSDEKQATYTKGRYEVRHFPQFKLPYGVFDAKGGGCVDALWWLADEQEAKSLADKLWMAFCLGRFNALPRQVFIAIDSETSAIAHGRMPDRGECARLSRLVRHMLDMSEA